MGVHESCVHPRSIVGASLLAIAVGQLHECWGPQVFPAVSQKTAAPGSSYIGSNVGAVEGCGLCVSSMLHLLLVISPAESWSKNSGIG
ncbi:Hypothetical protein PSEBR_m1286 [Pseudomonas brassicacearum subsp. brassicacearum NFM421]|uniref:Uncharacterized protein n=1 Tax=Pseudomonas brassicacearum (strain NFM421) TaxID=994484 RepID=F2KKA9_PSEBN|nr:Hypothetical protein PSEBR_m1286 [Pseudomonas brassicacearum subsp. brassicacearum NFM421]